MLGFLVGFFGSTHPKIQICIKTKRSLKKKKRRKKFLKKEKKELIFLACGGWHGNLEGMKRSQFRCCRNNSSLTGFLGHCWLPAHWCGAVGQFTALYTRFTTALFLTENMKGFLSFSFMPTVNSQPPTCRHTPTDYLSTKPTPQPAMGEAGFLQWALSDCHCNIFCSFIWSSHLIETKCSPRENFLCKQLIIFLVSIE